MSKPRINLLPYRQERRAQRQREFLMMLALVAIAGIVIVFFGNQVLTANLENQRDRNGLLRTEIAKLDKEIKEIDRIREEIRLAVERKKTVEALQNNRTVAVHLLDQMIRQLPDGVYLESSSQRGNQVKVVGFAQSNAHVSAFMRNVESSEWIESPKLVVTQLTQIDNSTPGQSKSGARDGQKRVAFEFTLNFTIRSVPAKPKAIAPTSTASAGQGRA